MSSTRYNLTKGLLLVFAILYLIKLPCLTKTFIVKKNISELDFSACIFHNTLRLHLEITLLKKKLLSKAA